MHDDAIDRIVHQWNRERPDLDVSVTHVLQRISRVYLLQSAAFGPVFARFGITFGEFEVLAALLRSGPPHQMSPSDLVGAVVLSSGAMTNRIDRVEALGLVERRPDPSDRRGTLVALTKQGVQTVDAAVADHLENEERLLTALSSAERRTLAQLLRKLLLSEPFAALNSARAIDHGTRRAPRAGGHPRKTAARRSAA
jgi:DNA-binding MarR family transcriptional regulator